MADKFDYSALLDDEFLNHSERTRAVANGAARVLGAEAWDLRRRVSFAQCAALVGLAAASTITLVLCMFLATALFDAHHQVLAFSEDADGSAPHSAALARAEGAMPVHHHVHEHEHEHVHQHGGGAENDGHLLAMTGHYNHTGEDDHPDHQDDDHRHPGDVVLDDGHIEPAESESASFALLFCLPPRTNASSETFAAAGSGVSLTRSQRDVVTSAVSVLGDAAQCHVVLVDVANGTANASTPSSRGEQLGFRHTGCGWPAEDGDGSAGAEAVGELVLSGGRSLPVVRWPAARLFARSPLAARWQALRHRAGDDGDLLELAARLLLLWRFGGVSVNLHASADQVLKTLSAFDREGSDRVYVETTRATVLAAPMTCSAIVFELIEAVQKEAYDVFGGLLSNYCSLKAKRASEWGSPQTTSTPPPSTSPTTSDTEAAAGSDMSESGSAESSSESSSEDVAVAAPADTRRQRGKASFILLRSGRPAATTTTPGPEPQDILLNVTRCRNNLVVIALP